MKFWLYFASIVFLAACGSDPAQLTADQQGSASLHSNAFKITTFNIKWYGLKTDNPDAPVGDFRDSYLLRFVEENFSDNDAIMFTEVVNKTHLMELMAHKMNCVSYEGRGRMHQHVVLCYDKFKYRVEAYDDDFMIPEVNIRKFLRPALQA
ncbi:MAG: hypothetical protein KDD33_08975, partial [Bdellovibrionales bacterium]|nr:hypothetical protein [Bdellovibrionales bacterium]